MSDTGKQSPLGVNVNSSLLIGQGLTINTTAAGYMGVSKTNTDYSYGSIINNTCLKTLTDAITAAYSALGLSLISASTYDAILSIGQGTIPALGNTIPPTYIATDPSGAWTGQATTGYGQSTGNTGQGQAATWIPWSTTNVNKEVTKYGFIRVLALQAWNEFNWNGIPATSPPTYRDFILSFQSADSFTGVSNSSINSMKNSQLFLKGTYSNMNDLISADLTGVSLSTSIFGQDCITAGKVIDLSNVASFGLPSVLLQTLNKYNALTQSLSLALLASGLTISDTNNIIAGTTPFISRQQEQQIYGAFLVIVGQDLRDTLIPLNCKTQGLTSLADLLNVKKLFPNSYQTLTVPVYNTNPSISTSKIYYPIFEGTAVNGRLSSPTVTAQVGTIVPSGTPPIGSTVSGTNFQVPSTGFGSYLDQILPDDVATSAGAFSATMQQIKNIQTVDFEKFSQVMASIETTKGLSDVGGTDVPVNTDLVDQALPTIALGSGPNGTYTMSDFFGCMSGLPYMWADMQATILATQTASLKTIYDTLYSDIVGLSAPVPPSTESDVLTDVANANAEIAAILSNNPVTAKKLNTLYNAVGTQLKIEQRARYIAIQPVPSPRITTMSSYPTTIYNFVDSIPGFAKNTAPHMTAPTLEAIADTSVVGGQSIVAMLRQERNQERLSNIGVPLDNGISDAVDPKIAQLLLANGTAPVAVDGIPISPTISYTVPQVLPGTAPVAYIDPNTDKLMVSPRYVPQSPIQSILMVTPDQLGPASNGTGPGQDIAIVIAGPNAPVQPGLPIDQGQAVEPGSLAGSPLSNLLPRNLSMAYISGVVSPSSYSLEEAINTVIKVNCNCWCD